MVTKGSLVGITYVKVRGFTVPKDLVALIMDSNLAL